MFNKRGVSPVVATVLLIVITVIVAAIILTFVLPFVDDKLGESKACLDVLDSVEFAESSFNCYNETYQAHGDPNSPSPQSASLPPVSITMETGFSVRVKLEEIYGFRIGLIDKESGSSETYDIIGSSTSTQDQVRMKGETWPSNSPLIIPQAGGIRTYIAGNKYDGGEISVLMESGQVCSIADSIDFRHCTTGVDLN